MLTMYRVLHRHIRQYDGLRDKLDRSRRCSVGNNGIYVYSDNLMIEWIAHFYASKVCNVAIMTNLGSTLQIQVCNSYTLKCVKSCSHFLRICTRVIFLHVLSVLLYTIKRVFFTRLHIKLCI